MQSFFMEPKVLTAETVRTNGMIIFDNVKGTSIFRNYD